MKYLKHILLPGISTGILAIAACEKYKDPDAPNVDLGDRVYCNDPVAANYNQGFPGRVDNATCIYATEAFEGTWLFKDSVFLPDMTFLREHTYTLNFVPGALELDTLRNTLSVAGFCPSGTLAITANKFSLAFTDTLIQYTDGGQYFCQETDTVSGLFRVITDSLGTRMNIQLTEMAQDGSYIHNGFATKQ